MESKEKLEKELRKLIQDAVDIREQPNTDNEWKILKTKLTKDIWQYARKIYHDDITKCGIEIIEIVGKLLKWVDPTKGDPIHYLNKSIKNCIKKMKKSSESDKSRGGIVAFPEKKIEEMKRWSEGYGKDINSPETQEWLTQVLPISIEEVKTLSQDDELFKISQISSENNQIKSPPFLSYMPNEDEESLDTVLLSIQETWKKSQERTKKYLSALITRQLLSELGRIFPDTKLLSVIQRHEFCDKSILEKYLTYQLPTQEDVARQFNKDKSDASRTMATFVKKIENITNKKNFVNLR